MAFEFAILDWIRSHLSSGFMDVLMPAVTFLGNGGWFWIVCGIALLFFRRYRKWGVYLLSAMLVGLLIGNLGLKPLIARARPCWVRDVELLIEMPKDFSYPSGHTLHSVIAATVLCLVDKRFRLPAIVLASLIAFSRLYLYVHFPTDILGGALMGILLALATVWIGETVRKKLTKSV